MSNQLSPRQEVWRGLLYGQRSMLLRLVGELKRDFSLTITQYEALLSLWEAPERTMTASQLAGKLLYSSGSMTHLVKRLEELGYVARTVGDQDARVVCVTLLPAGKDLIERATKAHVASIAKEFEPLIPDDEVEVLLRFARRLSLVEGVASHPEGEALGGNNS